MKLGFKAGFMTALGVLAAFYLYQLVTYLLTQFIVGPLLRTLLG